MLRNFKFYAWGLLLELPLLSQCWAVEEPIRWAKVMGLACIAALSCLITISPFLPLPYLLFIAYYILCAVITGFGFVQLFSLGLLCLSLVAAAPWLWAPRSLFLSTLQALAISGCVTACLAYLNMANIWPFLHPINPLVYNPPAAFIGQHTLLGPFLVACLCASLTLGWRTASLFILIPIVVVNSSFTFLSLVVALFVMYSRVFRWPVFAVGSAASVLACLCFPSLLVDNGRFRLWGEIVANMYGHWVFGRGPGSFIASFPALESESLKQLAGVFHEGHNEIMQLLWDMGLVGVGVAFLCLLHLGRVMWNRRHDRLALCCSAIVLSFLANGMGNFLLHEQPHGVIFLISIICLVTMPGEGECQM